MSTMGTTDSLHGGGAWQIGGETENGMALLKTMLEKMNMMEMKMDHLQGTVDEIKAAILPGRPGEEIKLVSADKASFPMMVRHDTSGYIQVNSHNNHPHAVPSEALHAPKTPPAVSSLPQSPIRFSAPPGGQFVTLEEGVELGTQHVVVLDPHDESSDDDNDVPFVTMPAPAYDDDEDDDDDDDEDDDDDDDDDDDESTTSGDAEVDPSTGVLKHKSLKDEGNLEETKAIDNKSQSDDLSLTENKPNQTFTTNNNNGINFGLPAFVDRTKSPLPLTEREVGHDWCKRTVVDSSEDNRARYFVTSTPADTVSVAQDLQASLPGKPEPVPVKEESVRKEDNTPSETTAVDNTDSRYDQGIPSKALSQTAVASKALSWSGQGAPNKALSETTAANSAFSRSGRFVTNNQMVTTSGFRNDHGPRDNRFDNEAHNETPSFLATPSTDLSNIGIIQKQQTVNTPDRSDVRSPIQTNGFADDHATPTSRSNEDASGRVPATAGGGYTGVSPAHSSASLAGSNSLNSSGRSDLSSPRTTGKRPSSARHTDSDSEKDPFVGDAYIQALIQTQKSEAQSNNEPKSQGLDTVICLDISQSMVGQPLEQAKDVIYTFLDGLEAATVDFDLEENVAMVTFGRENKVQQHLTNNYDAVRDHLDSLEAGGPSPMWLGLALALTELSTRGGSCKMSDLSVLPRIILISDGFATEKNRLYGDDRDYTEQQTGTQIQNLVGKNKGSVSCIDCVTVGVNDKHLLSEISSGRVFTTDDLQYLTEFFRVKSIANTCVSRSREGGMSEQTLTSMVQAYNLSDQRSLADGMSEIRNRITLVDETATGPPEPTPAPPPPPAESTTGPRETTPTPVEPQNDTVTASSPAKQDGEPTTNGMETSISEMNDAGMSESVIPGQSLEDQSHFPEFGTRVLANPGWEGYVNNKDFVGTVVGHRKDRLKVLWTDGAIEKCCYGDNGKYDVKVTDSQDMDNSKMGIGARIQRGDHWKWGEQDGGVGNVGIVYKVDDKKKVVNVIWANNQQGNYRYGYKSYYDVQLVPNSPETAQPDKGETEQLAVWEIELSESVWTVFPEEVCQSIEDMYTSKPRGTFLIKTNNTSYRISLVQCQARNLDTQQVYPIQRKVLTKDEWLELARQQ